MRIVKKTTNRREALTLIELLVVVAIILAVAALAAAFAPRVSDSQNLTRAVDQLEQWLLTAKMRAKRDGLATGIRFIPDPNNPNSGLFSEFQYIQQPDSLTGGWLSSTNVPGSVTYNSTLSLYLTGGICTGATAPSPPTTTATVVNFSNVDFTAGTPSANQYLVQQGDFLEFRDGGVYQIASVVVNSGVGNALQLGSSAYDTALTISTPTTNYRILRQPRPLIGEAPLQLPNNLAVDMNTIPGTTSAGNVPKGASGLFYEILFSPSGAVVGAGAGSGKLLMYVHDVTQNPVDLNRAAIVAVQTRTGFIGAYSVATTGGDPFLYAEEGRSSGL